MLSSCLDQITQLELPALLVLMPSEISTSLHILSGSFTGGHRGRDLDPDSFLRVSIKCQSEES